MAERMLIAIAVLTVACGGGEEKGAPSGRGDAVEAEAGAGDEAPARGAEAVAWDPALGSAHVTGTVRLEGPPPRRRSVDMDSDPVCHESHEEKIKDESVIVSEDGGLRNVIVRVSKGLSGWEFPVPADPVVLSQEGCVYTPHVFGMQAGQTLVIHNKDQTTHNVHAYPKKNPAFNQTQAAGGSELEKVMSRSENLLTIKCDIHGWMSSYVSVVEHPFFMVTGDDGSFDLGALPPGEYTIEARHEVFGRVKETVTVGAGETATIDFTFSGS